MYIVCLYVCVRMYVCVCVCKYSGDVCNFLLSLGRFIALLVGRSIGTDHTGESVCVNVSERKRARACSKGIEHSSKILSRAGVVPVSGRRGKEVVRWFLFLLCVFLPFCPKGYNHDGKGEEKWWRLEKNLNLVDPLAVANQFLEEQVSGSYGTGSAKICVQDISGSRHKTMGDQFQSSGVA